MYGLLEELQTFEKPYQSWIEIVDEDASLDAIYIHTRNPNEGNFPLKIENLNWNCTVPKYLKDIIDLKEFNVGHYKWDSYNNYIVQSKNNRLEL